MVIKQMVIEAREGRPDVEVARTDDGALVTVGNRIVCELKRAENDEAQFAKAMQAAGEVYGTYIRRSGKTGIQATNSMIHDVWRAIQQVAGC